MGFRVEKSPEVQYYCTRKLIIDEIMSRSSRGRTPEEAVRLLEAQRTELRAKPMSLDAFQKALKLARKKETAHRP